MAIFVEEGAPLRKGDLRLFWKDSLYVMSLVGGVLTPFAKDDFSARAKDILRNRPDPAFTERDAWELDMYRSVGWATPSKRYLEMVRYFYAAIANGELSPIREHTFESKTPTLLKDERWSADRRWLAPARDMR